METLSWENLESSMASGVPVLLPMGGTRDVRIGFDPQTNIIFVRVAISPDVVLPPSPYAELMLNARMENGQRVMELATASPHLYREFHRFAGLLTEEYEQPGQTPVSAFLLVLERWRELASSRSLLSPDEQLGLLGELTVLESLIRAHGPAAIKGWTARAPDIPERHDFRIGAVDLEVKSTRTATRTHVIHGLRQLQPSAGHTLLLISLKFEAAGLANGSTLPDRVSIIRRNIKQAPLALEEFDTKLQAANYGDSDAAHYQHRFIFAEPPVAIPVDEYCPALTSTVILEALGNHLAQRIDSVVYRINVENLGQPIAGSVHETLLGRCFWDDL